MSESDPTPLARPRRQGFWLTMGEVVGVLALVIGGLNYWESHQQHLDDARRAQAQTRAATAFVAVGEADRNGHSVSLHPLKDSQAIQSQRYRFPDEVLDHPVEITAGRPKIEADGIAAGLKRVLDESHARASGEARVPLVMQTVFVEDGDTQSDVSLYQLGFSWKRSFLGGRQIRLTGLALAKRGLPGDPTLLLQSRWTAAKAALAAR
jgi:hypothetical protein